MPFHINASLTTQTVDTIKDQLNAIKASLPFLITLSAGERRSTFKMGPDSLSFVTNARTAVADNPDVLPGSFDKEAFERDCDLFAKLTELYSLTASLLEQIDDTRVATGGECMTQSLQAYEYFKTAAKTTPGLKSIVDQLSERFRKSGGDKGPPPPPPHP